MSGKSKEGDDRAPAIGGAVADVGVGSAAAVRRRRVQKQTGEPPLGGAVSAPAGEHRSAEGDPASVYEKALELEEAGQTDQAEALYRQAAEAGHAAAANNLGLLLDARGAGEEAEGWYRRGAESGSLDAAYNLALLLHERGAGADAETWFRKAAEAGDAAAAYPLGGQ